MAFNIDKVAIEDLKDCKFLKNNGHELECIYLMQQGIEKTTKNFLSHPLLKFNNKTGDFWHHDFNYFSGLVGKQLYTDGPLFLIKDIKYASLFFINNEKKEFTRKLYIKYEKSITNNLSEKFMIDSFNETNIYELEVTNYDNMEAMFDNLLNELKDLIDTPCFFKLPNSIINNNVKTYNTSILYVSNNNSYKSTITCDSDFTDDIICIAIYLSEITYRLIILSKYLAIYNTYCRYPYQYPNIKCDISKFYIIRNIDNIVDILLGLNKIQPITFFVET